MKKSIVAAICLLASFEASAATIRIVNHTKIDIYVWLYPDNGKPKGPYLVKAKETETYMPIFQKIRTVAWHYKGKTGRAETKVGATLPGSSPTGKYAADLDMRNYAKLEISPKGLYEVTYGRFPSPRGTDGNSGKDIAMRKSEEALNGHSSKKRKKDKKCDCNNNNRNNNDENYWKN